MLDNWITATKYIKTSVWINWWFCSIEPQYILCKCFIKYPALSCVLQCLLQTSNHCSDDRAFEVGWLVTGYINSQTLLREIREKPGKQRTNQRKSFFERWWFFSKKTRITLKTHLDTVDKKNQLDVTCCILYFSSNGCSTCFGQPWAHHQELTTAWCYSLVLVYAVAAGRLSRPVGR